MPLTPPKPATFNPAAVVVCHASHESPGDTWGLLNAESGSLDSPWRLGLASYRARACQPVVPKETVPGGTYLCLTGMEEPIAPTRLFLEQR